MSNAFSERPQPALDESEFHTIKSFLEVYKVIFTKFTECQPQLPVTSIEVEYSPSAPPKYTMYLPPDFALDKSSDALTTGLQSLPEGTPSELQAAYMNLWMCDYSLEALLEPVRETLCELNAHVQWLVLNPMPRFLLNFRKADNEVPSHSVMGITTHSGEHFIADFTGAQLGYDFQDWFMHQQDYLDRYTEDGWWELHEDAGEAVEVGWGALRGVEGKVWLEKLREVAHGVDWVGLEGLSREQRLEAVGTEARGAFERLN
jgi:hypothetical protein